MLYLMIQHKGCDSQTDSHTDPTATYAQMWEVGIRVSHLQFFLISELFQAGMNVCHTQEQ